MSDGTTTWTYTYDANGMRTKRTNGSTTYSYVYNGSQLTQLTVNGVKLTFTYGTDGTPTSVTYDSTRYFYAKNLQGDVMALVSVDGNVVVEYTYDAWGNILTTSGSLASTLGVRNPLRYRGYVYDCETNLYYLQSRYYDPQVGRFINADSLIGVDNLIGQNLYAYCDNNPVIKVDYSGCDGKIVELGNGWYYRIDPADTNSGTERHIHIWNKHTGKEYMQNDDGRPHDKGKGQKGKLPKWLNNKLIEKANWDYNGKRNSFYENTECACTAEGTLVYTYSDGTIIQKSRKPFVLNTFSVDEFEYVYHQNSDSITTTSPTQTFYLPIIGPISFPSFSFSFGWGLFPIPIFA